MSKQEAFVPGPRSAEFFTAAKKSIPGGVNSPVRAFRSVGGDPFFVDRAAGCRIRDVDGNERIDYVGTWGPAILGHAPEVVIEAVTEAARQGVSFGIPNPYEVEIAELVCEWVPSVEKVRMVNSGTEATMSAIRVARGFTGRNKIIKFEGCYHGHVDSLLVAAGSGALNQGTPNSAGVPEGFVAETLVVPFNDRAAVEAAFEQHGDDMAGVILEPFPANAGLIFPDEGFLEFLREITTRYGALLIFDEVMTGFRLARGGVQELVGVTPDLTAMGKVIGGGLPVGAFGGRADIMDVLAPLGDVYQAGTLSGNPLAMAAGMAQLKEMDRIGGYQRLEELGAQLETGVRSILNDMGLGLTFHRVGSMFCLFFTDRPVRNVQDVMAGNSDAFAGFFHASLKEGVYFAPSAFEAGFISCAHDEAAIGRTLEVVESALKSVY